VPHAPIARRKAHNAAPSKKSLVLLGIGFRDNYLLWLLPPNIMINRVFVLARVDE
jgi:hypothetical protein